MFRNRSVDTHQFSMIPRAEIPRSSFRIQKTVKSTFDAGLLYPIYVDEILPGDSFNLKLTMFGRMATPIFPIMDNLTLETFFFFVPCRLVWDNWKRFMGEQPSPGDSTSFLVPQCVSGVGGFDVFSVFDYFGLPTDGQVDPAATVSVNALPLRAYNLIWNEWFRDENLEIPMTVPKGDGPDTISPYSLHYRGKRHDYFTSCLPWTQKGNSVQLPLGSSAPILPLTSSTAPTFANPTIHPAATQLAFQQGSTDIVHMGPAAAGGVDSPAYWVAPGLYADLTAATAATINQIRQAFQI